jgi:hypothetical protein
MNNVFDFDESSCQKALGTGGERLKDATPQDILTRVWLFTSRKGFLPMFPWTMVGHSSAFVQDSAEAPGGSPKKSSRSTFSGSGICASTWQPPLQHRH